MLRKSCQTGLIGPSVRTQYVILLSLSGVTMLTSPLVQILHAHPSSVLFTRVPTTSFVIYHEVSVCFKRSSARLIRGHLKVIETTKRFMRDITSIEQDWLPELA